MMSVHAAVVAALATCVASLRTQTDQGPAPEIPDTLRVADPRLADTSNMFQWSEVRLGPPMLTSMACSVPWNFSNQSEWKEKDPIVFPEAGIGARRRMVPIGDMDYQLYLPHGWGNNSLYPFATTVYFHSHPERKWSLMNSGSLPRMLARNQSTSFDNRSCWCLDMSLSSATAYLESGDPTKAYDDGAAPVDLASPMADCTFADTFNGLVIMPQGWVRSETPGWSSDRLANAKAITKAVMGHFNGDADKVIVTGTAEGATGAVEFAKAYKNLVSAVILTDAPDATYTDGLEGVPVYVTGDASQNNIASIDSLVVALKGRASGVTKYTRYVSGPSAADPEFGAGYGHSSDIIYRDPQLWAWASQYKNTGGRAEWGMSPLGHIVMS